MVPVSMPLVMYALLFNFILEPSEESSNLSRYDGLKYGFCWISKPPKRRWGLKKEARADRLHRAHQELGFRHKREALSHHSNFLLSSRFEAFKEKVIEAQKIRRLIIDEYCKVFEGNQLDLILSPVAIGELPKIEDILNQTEKNNPVFE